MIAAFPERFTALSHRQVQLINNLVPFPDVHEPSDDLLQLPLEVKP